MRLFATMFLFLIPRFVTAQDMLAQYTLAIATDRPVIQADDDFIVHATLTNTSDHQDLVAFGYLDSDYAIDLRDSSGNKVPESAYSRRVHYAAGNVSTGVFPPFPAHATRTVKVDIAKYFDIPGPGTYTVEFSKMSLRSNLLTVTLLPGNASTPSQQPAPGSTVFAAPSSSGAARENFSLQIEVDRSTVLVGNEIPVYTRLANLSAATVHVPATANGLGFGLDVRDAGGQPVPETELGGQRKRWAQETPGQYEAIPRFRIGGVVDLAKFLDMATPGTYTVQLYWDVPAGLGGGQVRSNVLRITVRARNTQ